MEVTVARSVTLEQFDFEGFEREQARPAVANQQS